MYCELQRKQKPVPNHSTGKIKLQKNAYFSNHSRSFNQLRMGVFPFVEGFLDGRSVKDIAFLFTTKSGMCKFCNYHS